MAKLMKFQDTKRRTVFINPDLVAMVEQTNASEVCVYFGGVEVPSVMLKGDADEVVAQLLG